MGDKRALEQAKATNSGEDKSENKLAEFGRGLFSKGKSLLEDAQKQVEKIDLKDLSRKAEDLVNKQDLGKLASEAGKAARNIKPEEAAAIAGVAAGAGFPQLAILNRGSGELGDLIARKQAKALLDDPKLLADKLSTSFDELDREKSGYLDDAKLRKFDGIGGIGSENRAISQILRSGFSTFNSLDGNQSRDGISRKDIEIFSRMQNQELLSDYAAKTAFNHGLSWGLAGAGAGAAGAYLKTYGADFSMATLKTIAPGRLALAATAGALAAGGVSYLVSRFRQNSFYEEKGRELDSMIKSMKNSF